MSQNNLVASSMSQLSTNLQVGMEDVVNVFISRLEDDLHAKREELQTAVRNLKSKVEDLTTEQQNRSNEVELTSFQTPFVDITQKFNEVEVSWEKSLITVDVLTNVRSLKYETKVGYYNKEAATVEVQVQLPISSAAIAEYNQLHKDISDRTADLVKVNNELRDMSRKERKVRGVIASMKLKDMGMEDLLNEPQLLAIVNNS
jgi:hypothetical protein